MASYNFTRNTLPSGAWDIDHPDRVERLAKEIETAIPGHDFTVRCDAGNCSVDFPGYTLTSGEETTLTETVSDHQNNV